MLGGPGGDGIDRPCAVRIGSVKAACVDETGVARGRFNSSGTRSYRVGERRYERAELPVVRIRDVER